MAIIKGRIVRIESKDYYVLDSHDNIYRCNLPGKFKKKYALKKDKLRNLDIAALGDFVDIKLNEDGTGTIAEIEDRKNILSRKAPKIKGGTHRGERFEQVVGTNLDNLVVVASIARPELNNRLIDRLIVAGESAHIDVTLVINKIDLDADDYALIWRDVYESLGYKVFLTNAVENVGTYELRKYLSNKVNIFWGSSGVGKSSILNSLFPELNFKVGEVSDYSNKGQHTTVTSIMQKTSENTFIIDTPGIREMDPYGIKKQDLGHYFVDIADYSQECKFNTCTHHHEPGCAVIKAVEDDEILLERYESYLHLLDTIEDDMFF